MYNKKSIYIDLKNHQKKIFYIILQLNNRFKIFRVEGDKDKKDEEVSLRTLFTQEFDSLMSEKGTFVYEDITHRVGSDFLLFGTTNREKFDEYFLIKCKKKAYYLEIDFSLSFQFLLIYDVSQDLKPINHKGEEAISSLFSLLNSDHCDYYSGALDVFLISTPSFRELNRDMSSRERESFKQTIINSMMEKIYDNIREDRGSSNLRFALVLVKNSLRDIDRSIWRYLFYDIKNGINLNREIIKSYRLVGEALDVLELTEQRISYLYESDVEKEHERRFILLLLNSILRMKDTLYWDKKKAINLASYICYLAFTEDIKVVVNREGVERLKIDYTYMILVELLTKVNSSYFIMLLEKFLNSVNNISIEKFLEQHIEYEFIERKKEKTLFIKMGKDSLSVKYNTLRQNSSRFFKNVLIIGEFYRLISEEKDMDMVIALSLQKILKSSINVKKCAKDPISAKFLTLFLKGHSKKNCESGLRDFFDSSKSSMELLC